VFAVVVAWQRWPPLHDVKRRRAALALVVFAVLYAGAMSLVAKKFDRYLLPVFPVLDLLAGLGWVGAIGQLGRVKTGWRAQGKRLPRGHIFASDGQRLPSTTAFGLALVVALQAATSLPFHPYYFSYYDPLVGGAATAPDVMMIGWGEGLDEAAHDLNAKPGADRLRVASWYAAGPFSDFFKGRAIPIYSSDNLGTVLQWLTSDYVILYVNQWQRQLPSREVLAYFASLTPETVIRLHGLEYARIYNMHNARPFDYLKMSDHRFVDWGGAIRLVDYSLPDRPVVIGQPFQITFYLQNVAPLKRNFNVLVRLLGPRGREWVRDEGWPWGSPTSTWELRDVWPDGHELTIPAGAPAGYYRLEVSFYDPETLMSLPATDARTHISLGKAVTVDYIAVGDLPTTPAHPLSPPADFVAPGATAGSPLLRLLGANVSNTTRADISGDVVVAARPGDSLNVRIFWEAQRQPAVNYAVFVHLAGPAGRLVAQHDHQPQESHFPTSFWKPGQVIPDDCQLVIPPDAPNGIYELRVGMYDSTSGERLAVRRAGRPSGDYVSVATIHVE